MSLVEILQPANKRIIFLGVLPVSEEIINSLQEFTDLLDSTPELKLSILCESETLCFQYSILTDTRQSINRKSYTKLITHRDRILGTKTNKGFFQEVYKLSNDENLADRVLIMQQNAIMPFSAIVVDNEVYIALTLNTFPTLDDYEKLDDDNPRSKQIIDYATFFLDSEGKQYLSSPGDELLQLYDKEDLPRGVYPRSCFYTTKFKRHSIWGFVFNRKGELLLHQRSKKTKDGRGLWDKSVGGHIDLGENAIITTKRELIEELFMAEAEYTSYIDARIKDILSFGEWNLEKRAESSYKGAFDLLDTDDWILFSATNKKKDGQTLTVDRVSQRRFHWNKKGEAENVEFRPTNFVSDVFLLIAPKNCIDTHKEMKERFKKAEEKGAAQDHKIISIDELKDWIEDETQKGNHMQVFTDDLIYINNEHLSMLEQFSEFIKYIFNE